MHGVPCVRPDCTNCCSSSDPSTLSNQYGVVGLCAQVQYDPETTGPRDLISSVEKAGYEASLEITRWVPVTLELTSVSDVFHFRRGRFCCVSATRTAVIWRQMASVLTAGLLVLSIPQLSWPYGGASW